MWTCPGSLSDGGGHGHTSKDKDGTQAAMLALLTEDAEAARVFCLLYLDDYLLGNYELPEACVDIQEELLDANDT